MDKQQLDVIDLNIGENYLNNWDVYCAIREIIANALDEQNDGNILIIDKGKDEYIIKDFGTGLKIENFIMMGSNKATKNHVIGKFGVGLKDALGVLNNHGIEVKVKTAKYLFEFHMKEKSKITNIKTLHVYVYKNNKENFKGTEFHLKKCKKIYMEEAKEEFLKFKKYKVNYVEKTCYGDVLEKQNIDAEIYINGMKISEDKNLLFSYNIRNISPKLKKCINRERKYVSRDAYREDIKRIIEECRESILLNAFEDQLKRTYSDNSYVEIKWNKVLVKTCNYIIKKYKDKNVRFICNPDILYNKELYDILYKSKNMKIINISEKAKIDMCKYRKNIIGNNLFIEDSIIVKEELLNKEDLKESQKNILSDAIDILSDIDLLKSDYISLNNIKISKIPVLLINYEGLTISIAKLRI